MFDDLQLGDDGPEEEGDPLSFDLLDLSSMENNRREIFNAGFDSGGATVD